MKKAFLVLISSFLFIHTVKCQPLNKILHLKGEFNKQYLTQIFEQGYGKQGSKPELIEFKESIQNYPFVRNSDDYIWIKFSLKNEEEVETVLHFENPRIQEFNIFRQEEGSLSIEKMQDSLSSHLSGKTYYLHLAADKLTTLYVSIKTPIPYLSLPVSIQPFESFKKNEKSEIFNWAFFLGFIFCIILGMMLVSLVLKMPVFLLTSIWFLSMSLLFSWQSGLISLGFNDELASSIYLLLRGLPVILFLVLFRKITIIESSKTPTIKNIFSILLNLGMISQGLIILVNWIYPALIKNYYLWFQIMFWLVAFAAFVISFKWSLRAIKDNKAFGLFIITFFFPFFGYLFAVANNAFAITSFSFPTAKSHFFGLLIQMGFLSYFLFKELTANLNKSVASEIDLIEIEGKLSEQEINTELSKRENEILLAYANGFTYQEISNSFFISPHTVRSHLKNIYKKLNINSKIEVFNYVNGQGTNGEAIK